MASLAQHKEICFISNIGKLARELLRLMTSIMAEL
jgi:hypothetical protein